ncbi:uncharacterized protein LOC112564756 [Pomacea canaliculata]|uniref:uncharacterized protein LOC112564756 n=1 Tax=Pomacea canaliculata TaxID=400727 RepID=UPI000D72CDC8|nr:uncharacterized protein LOC112564756 [Pomacea canaliculata]XP_025095588.1 uncharacterized protein LOC112564756 [Pomacea canaliculata]
MQKEKQVPTDVAYWHDIYRVTDDLLRPGISVDESQRMYDQWAKMGTYDALAVESNYLMAHDQIILGILSMYPVRRDIRILDVGAGTGLVGERLRNLGFERVDSLDPSAEMLRSAAKKGVYERLIHSFFTNNPSKILMKTHTMPLSCVECLDRELCLWKRLKKLYESSNLVSYW